MKSILVILCLTFGCFAYSGAPYPKTKGFNYSGHYKKSKRVKVINRLFNSNNCNHVKYNV